MLVPWECRLFFLQRWANLPTGAVKGNGLLLGRFRDS